MSHPRRRQVVVHRDHTVSHKGEVVGRVVQHGTRWVGQLAEQTVTRQHRLAGDAAVALVRHARPAGPAQPRISLQFPGQALLPWGRADTED